MMRWLKSPTGRKKGDIEVKPILNRYDKPLVEALHALIALGPVLGYLYVLDLFQPSYPILLRGVVWNKIFKLDLPDLGFYVFLPFAALTLTLGIYIYSAGGLNVIKPFKLARNVLAILTVLNLPPLLYWIAYLWDPQLTSGYGPERYRWVSEFDAMLLNTCAPAYPILLLATLYAWMAPLISMALKRRIKLKVRCREALKEANCPSSSNISSSPLGLISALFLSIALPLIPYLPTINPEFKPVSVDIKYYTTWLDNMLMGDIWNAVNYAFYGRSGNRPLYLLLLYGLTSLGIQKEFVLNLEALFIAPFFALAVYFSAKRISRSNQYAVLASLGGLLGFNMTVGMMAGFFAAWTALMLFYSCIALTPDLEKPSPRSLALYLIASIVALYIHPWTWGLLMAVLTAYLAYSTLSSLNKGSIRVNKYLLTVLAVNAVVDLLKTALTPNYGGAVSSATLVLDVGSYWFENLIRQRWYIYRLMTSYVGGLFFNPLHMTLALLGVLSLLKRRSEHSKLILTWVALTSLIFPFSNVSLQSHLLFAMPFPILIAEGLWLISRFLGNFDPQLPKLFIAFFLVSSLTYTVRALCNLV